MKASAEEGFKKDHKRSLLIDTGKITEKRKQKTKTKQTM